MHIHKSLPLCLLLISSAAFSQSAPALTVSPGGLLSATQIADGCATFSWGPVDGATGYQVAVFDVLLDDSSDLQTIAEELGPVLETTIAAPALSWTPSSGQCLQQEGSYIWYVRATSEDGDEEWSEGRYFEVDYNGSVLAEAVAQEVTTQLTQPDTWRRAMQEALQTEPGALLLRRTAGRSAGLTQTRAGVIADSSDRRKNSGASTQGISPSALDLINPLAFRVSGGNGVVFDHDNSQTGDIPVEGEGVRFMWYPGKGALRAGYDPNSAWDDVNIGRYSVAMGNSTIASGFTSTALGRLTTASGNYSTASGFNSTASGNASSSMGDSTIASEFATTAMGWSTVASGPRSTAMGSSTTAIGESSTAMGASTTASGKFSTAMGNATTAPSFAETVIGRQNTIYTPGGTVNWIATDRLFVIGNGQGGNRSDAMVVLKNGDTKIGGRLQLPALDTGGSTAVCRNAANKLSFCSSSGRYKEQVTPLSLGLDIVQQLQPVTFKWKNKEGQDLGFVAEAVAGIDPLLAIYNNEGEIEGVKYKQLTAVLVNAIKTQQQQIKAQQSSLEQQQQRIAALEQDRQQLAMLRDELAEYRAIMQQVTGQLQADLRQPQQQAVSTPQRVALRP